MNTLPNLTFVLGGERSGKSSFTEQRAREIGDHVIYCATAVVMDEDMRNRVALHQARRPQAWRTVEAPRRVAEKLRAALEENPADCVLLDCLSVLTSNALLNMRENINEKAAYDALCEQELNALLKLIADFPETHWLIVSNEVGMDVVPAYQLGRTYRDVLGRANQFFAAAASEVYFLVAGIPMKIK